MLYACSVYTYEKIARYIMAQSGHSYIWPERVEKISEKYSAEEREEFQGGR